jgi:hypothetical protein
MTDTELIEIATEFREGILDGGPSDLECFKVVAPLAGLLEFYGLYAKVMESDVTIKRGKPGQKCNHFWIKLEDGRVLDPTADQFNKVHKKNMPPVYLGKPTLRLHVLARIPTVGQQAGDLK